MRNKALKELVSDLDKMSRAYEMELLEKVSKILDDAKIATSIDGKEVCTVERVEIMSMQLGCAKNVISNLLYRGDADSIRSAKMFMDAQSQPPHQLGR